MQKVLHECVDFYIFSQYLFVNGGFYGHIFIGSDSVIFQKDV